MVGTLAQLLSLVSFGNEYIFTGKLEADYYPQNSVFQYCKQVNFKTVKLRLFAKNKDMIAGNDPLEWFQFLKQHSCRELKAYYQHSKQQEGFKDHFLAGFIGGGGQWFIEAVYKDYSDFWYAHWNVGNKDDPDNKIWLVSYEAVARKNETKNIQFLLNKSWETLENKLKGLELFARENNLDSWAEWFSEAIKTLNSNTPCEGFYHPDMILLKNYSLQAQQLIYGAGKSWVFGGMGSWNDLGGFDGKEKQDKYNKLTEELYEAVIIAFLAGINS